MPSAAGKFCSPPNQMRSPPREMRVLPEKSGRCRLECVPWRGNSGRRRRRRLPGSIRCAFGHPLSPCRQKILFALRSTRSPTRILRVAGKSGQFAARPSDPPCILPGSAAGPARPRTLVGRTGLRPRVLCDWELMDCTHTCSRGAAPAAITRSLLNSILPPAS
jgi:hypothetical protein